MRKNEEVVSVKKNVKITILKSAVDKELAKQYAIPHFEACPFHKPGQFFSAMESISQMDYVNTHGSL